MLVPDDPTGDHDRPDSGTGRDPLAPLLTFMTPEAASDPNADTVVTEMSLSVRCQAMRSDQDGAVAVDKSSVAIVLVSQADGSKLLAPAMDALPNNEYEAKFDLSEIPSGPLRFACSGRDIDTPAHMDTVFLDTFLDRGPTIRFNSPNAKPYSLKHPVPVEFSVESVPLMEGDEKAAVQDVHLMVAGVEIPVTESPTTPGVYEASVDFDDRLTFPVAPMTAEFVATASNKRTPTAATSEARVTVSLDGEGPTLKVRAPADGQIVHGDVTLEIEASDASGLRSGSLTATINDGLRVIDQWVGAAPVFRQRFDTREIDPQNQLTRLTINISATDEVGNDRTISLLLKLDNLPPAISLDPPLIREYHTVKVNNVDGKYCSALFDPVGEDVPNDLELVSGRRRIRALVEDETNAPLSAIDNPSAFDYIAGTKTDSIAVFLQRDKTIPLLIDTNDDGICDEVNNDKTKLDPSLLPTKLDLSPVKVAGSPWYPLNTEPDDPGCYKPPANMSELSPPPGPICPGTEQRRVVPGRIEGYPVALYAVHPTNVAGNTGGECTGESWEFLTIANEGWNCLAARAEDNIGNIGISPPLRICYDDPTVDGAPACAASCAFISGTKTPVNATACAKSAPSCTDGCKLPNPKPFTYSEGNASWYFP